MTQPDQNVRLQTNDGLGDREVTATLTDELVREGDGITRDGEAAEGEVVTILDERGGFGEGFEFGHAVRLRRPAHQEILRSTLRMTNGDRVFALQAHQGHPD